MIFHPQVVKKSVEQFIPERFIYMNASVFCIKRKTYSQPFPIVVMTVYYNQVAA